MKTLNYPRIISSCIVSLIVGLTIKPIISIANGVLTGLPVVVILFVFLVSIMRYPTGKFFPVTHIATIVLLMTTFVFIGFRLYRIML